MNKNNAMYKNFKLMQEGYKLDTRDGIIKFESGVVGWMSLNPDNPFEENTSAYDNFYRMQIYYKSSLKSGPGSKFSKRQLINEAKALCETKPKCPYKYDKKAEEEDEAKRKAEEEAAKVAAEEYKAKKLAEKAARIVEEEQRKKQAQIQAQLAKAEEEAAELAELANEKALKDAIEKEREKYTDVHFEEEKQLELLKQKNEEEKAKLTIKPILRTAEPEDIVKPQVILGVLPEKKKSFFARLFKR